MSTEHTPPTAEEVAYEAIENHDWVVAQGGELAENVVDALRAAGLLPSDTPPPSAERETIHIGPDEGATVPLSFFADAVRVNRNTCIGAWRLLAAGKYDELCAFLAEQCEGGEIPTDDAYAVWQNCIDALEGRGLVAGSTDTLIEQLTERYGYAPQIDSNYDLNGDLLGWIVQDPSGACPPGPRRPTLVAALRAALASQPEPETKEQ